MNASILLIEDNAAINETTEELLTLASYTVLSTKCGKEGIELAHQYNPDLILCDILMPNHDGYAVLKTLKEDHTVSDIPFVFFSASAEQSDVKKGLSMGANGYICKPFTEETLLETIRKLLGQRVREKA